MTNSSQSKPRIAIYGTGQFGQKIARLADKKNWPIVAAFNRAGDKIGQNLGQLCGFDNESSIVIQDCEQFDFSTLNADVAIVTISDRLSTDIEAYRRLLDAGINVISIAAEAYYPAGTDKALANEIDTLAKQNNVSFTGTGIWDMSRIWSGILLAGPCTEINGLFHRSTTDLERVGKELMLKGGVGLTQEQFAQATKGGSPVAGLYQTISEQVLSSLGYTVKHSEEQLEPIIFDKPIYCKLLDRELEAGVVCGTRIITTTETTEGVNAKTHIELRLFEEGEVEHMYWKIDGKPSTNIRIERDDSAHFTAASLFNRIPDVIAAPAGIQIVSKLGPLKHTAL